MRKGLTRYAEYVPSGVPWIGELPRGWQVRRLKKVCRRIITGSTPPDEAFDESDEEGGIPWHTPGDFHAGCVDLAASSKRLYEDALSAGTVRRFPAGSTLLVGIGATLGKVAVTAHDCSGNQQINCLIPSHDADGRFMALLLSVMTPSLKVSANAATLGILNQTKTGEFVIPCPPFPEQQAIVAFLDRETAKIDRLKDVRRRQIEVLREQRAAVIHHAVTQGLDPAAPKKDSGIPWLGEVPEHWEVVPLWSATHVRFSNVDKKTVEGQHPVLLCNYVDVYKNEFITNELEFMEASATDPQIKTFELRIGDVLLTKDSEDWEDIAVPALVRETQSNLLCGYHLAMLRARRDVCPGYLFRLFQTKFVRSHMGVRAGGVTRYGLSTDSIKRCPCPLPPLAEQEAIVAHIDEEAATIDALIGKYERELELLDEYRASLISHAVTGKIDVRGLFLEAQQGKGEQE